MSNRDRFKDKNGNWKGGVSVHPWRNKWDSMKQRCYNPNNKAYKNYGDRGISICDEWINNINAYIYYIENLQNAGEKGFSIDRIDNDGNYEPGNLRWTSPNIQTLNQRNPRGLKGVSWHKRDKRWMSTIGINNQRIYIGCHITINDAIIARNSYIIKHKLINYKLQTLKNYD